MWKTAWTKLPKMRLRHFTSVPQGTREIPVIPLVVESP